MSHCKRLAGLFTYTVALILKMFHHCVSMRGKSVKKTKHVGTIYNFTSNVLMQDVKIVQHHQSLKRRILFSVQIPLRFSKIMLGLPFEYLELYT